jgi:Rps23 Pro-64 3,4-dihydroxylase Tpa1-like proline 4-hydroxylase
MSMIDVAERTDVAGLADAFARDGYVQIPDFLRADSAVELQRGLRARGDWKQVLTAGDRYAELDRPTRAAMPAEQARAIDNAVYAQARTGFQYRYESIRVPDDRAGRTASADPLARLAEAMSGDSVRSLLRTVTGAADVQFADAQATAFSPGDFLTGHDDDVAGKDRRAAYVLNLTPTWRIEWGGLLLFHGPDGHVSRGLRPTFNALNIFRVPTLHSVSEVSRASPYRRYSVTGWLRAGQQP